MERRTLNFRIKAFTLIELLVIILTVFLIACFIISGLFLGKQKSRREMCVNNLKQVGLAFKLWPSVPDLFPMMRSKDDGHFERIVHA
jgi:competence protein ComGC